MTGCAIAQGPTDEAIGCNNRRADLSFVHFPNAFPRDLSRTRASDYAALMVDSGAAPATLENRQEGPEHGGSRRKPSHQQ